MQTNNFNILSPLEYTTSSFADTSTKRIMDKINVLGNFTKEQVENFISNGILEDKANPGLVTRTQLDCFFEALENYTSAGGEKPFSQCYDFNNDPDVLALIQKSGNEEILNFISQNLVSAAY